MKMKKGNKDDDDTISVASRIIPPPISIGDN
jgi:hypothetical protein